MSKIYVQISSKNIITSWAEKLTEKHIPIDGVLVETDLDLNNISLVGNYKLENGQLVELTEEEKELNKIDICEEGRIKTNKELTEELLQAQKIIADLEIENL